MTNFLGITSLKEPINSTFSDFIFFLILVAVPSSFFGILNDSFFYVRGQFDLIFFSLLVSFPYLFKYHYNLLKINKYAWGKYLIILFFFMLINFYISMVRGIPFSEGLKLFRYFFYPAIALGALLRIIEMDSNRIIRLFDWILISMTIQGIFYIIFILTGFNIFSQDIYMQQMYEGGLVVRYFKAMPILNNVVLYISTISLIQSRKNIKKYIIPFIVSILCVLLSSTRSIIISASIFFILSLILSNLKKGYLVKLKSIKILGLVILSLSMFYFIFPGYYYFFSNRLSEIGESESIGNVGNFELRIDLIKKALNSHQNTLDTIIGKGYKRYSTVGAYDLALGGDTHIAPVIFCEGLLGFIIRLIPIIILLIINAQRFIQNKVSPDIPILIIAAITSQFFNIIQTTMFKKYTIITLFLFVLDILYTRHQAGLQKEIKQRELTANHTAGEN